MDSSNSHLNIHAKHKIAFLGDSGVGKTSLINQFIYGTFSLNHNPTIGIDYLSKIINTGERSIRLQIWDTAGQERFRSLIPSYIRDASAIIIVYDVTSRTSYANVNRWLDQVRDLRGSDVVVCIAGNKVDVADKRVVTFEEQEFEFRNKGTLNFEVSAKKATNVNTMFKQITEKLPDIEEPIMLKAESVKLDSPIRKTEGGCSC